MSAELATPQTGARKERATQPKTGTQIPIVKQKSQRVQIVSERNNLYELKMRIDNKENVATNQMINIDLSSFDLVPQSEIELIMMNRQDKQIDLEDKKTQNQYPVIELDKILSVFFYEQEKMWKYSFLNEMYKKQNFTVFYTRDNNGTLLVARFFVRGLDELTLSIHHPNQVLFLFEDGYIASKLQKDTFQTKKLLFEAEPKESIIENIFLFIRETVFNKN